jgi:hypothetical protein
MSPDTEVGVGLGSSSHGIVPHQRGRLMTGAQGVVQVQYGLESSTNCKHRHEVV